MKFDYENLSDRQFEDLVTAVCQELLGISVQGFADGADGGKDAKFNGTAQLFPSAAKPWHGCTIIQAKHTIGYNRSFSEKDFFNPDTDSNIIAEEIPRIRNMIKAGELDHYMIFSNRKLSGVAQPKIIKHISKECDLPEESIYLCCVEQIERWLKKFPDIPGLIGLDPIDSPLIISPDEIAVVVEAFGNNAAEIKEEIKHPPSERISYELKNNINDMSADYAKAQRNKYLKDTRSIMEFLADPVNSEIRVCYENATEELNFQIISKRKDYQSFDEVMEYVVRLLFERDPVLRQHGNKRLTRALLFYMYWHCDIGKTDD